MDVSVTFNDNLVLFDFHLGKEDDTLLDEPIHIKSRSCFFSLPEKIDESKIHPDLLAFAILLSAYPFIKSQLNLQFSVSEEFALLCKKRLGIDLPNVSKLVKPRVVSDGRPGLAFSGGVDSSAALPLMPEDTVFLFMDRVSPCFKKTLYDKTAALNAVDEIKKIRKYVYKSESNMEHMRNKVGFPVDQLNSDINFAAALPIVLMADIYSIDAISYGAILETIFNVGHNKYIDYSTSEHCNKWSPFFDLVSCPLFLPVAGISEVGTSMIVNKLSFSNQIRSCMRGNENSPCKKCIKCFRKISLDQAIVRGSRELGDIVENLNSREVINNLYNKIKHENVYRYIADNLSSNVIFDSLKSRIQIESEDTTWMERWYPHSICLVPDKYQSDFVSRVKKYLDVMTVDDILFVESWDVTKVHNNNVDDLNNWRIVLESFIEDPLIKKHMFKLSSEESSMSLATVKVVDFQDWIKKI